MVGSPLIRARLAGVRCRWCTTTALLLLLAGALAHLWYLLADCPLDLSGDEAHYWEWSRRLDLSYYSKGPLVAYIIAASRLALADWSQRLVGSEVLAVRLPAILLSVGTGWGLFVLARQVTRSSRLALATVALTFTIPIFAVGAILMTIDAPLAFLFVWALVAVESALRTGRTATWLAAGLLIALGILAKYTMVLIFPAVLLTMLIRPVYRRALRQPGPYLAALLGLAGLLPILAWNARHEWVSFRHVAGQAGLSVGGGFKLLGPLDFLLGQLAVVGPVWFAAMLCAVASLSRHPEPLDYEQHDPAALVLLLVATGLPWGVFAAFSLLTKTQPNWPMLALLPGCIVLVCWLARLWQAPAAAARRWARGVVVTGSLLGSATVLVMHHTEWLAPLIGWLAEREPPWNLTPAAKYDPTARLRGWTQLGAAVGTVRAAEWAAGRDPFIITDDYQTASQIAFYCPGQPTVYCLQAALGDRQSQYDLWRPNPLRDPQVFVGRPCIYVGAHKAELFGAGRLSPALPAATLVQTVEHRLSAGNDHRALVVQVWSIYTCPAYAGLSAQPGKPARF